MKYHRRALAKMLLATAKREGADANRAFPHAGLLGESQCALASLSFLAPSRVANRRRQNRRNEASLTGHHLGAAASG